MCQMDFEVQGKTEQWLKLEKDGTGVEFLASRLLVEYQDVVKLATTIITFKMNLFFYLFLDSYCWQEELVDTAC